MPQYWWLRQWIQSLSGRADPGLSMRFVVYLTHWNRVTHIRVSKLTTIGSDNGLSPGRLKAIIWTNAGILSTGPSGINFSEILLKIHTFSFKKMSLKRRLWNGGHFVSTSMDGQSKILVRPQPWMMMLIDSYCVNKRRLQVFALWRTAFSH